jgi:hypothetical protein
MPERLTSGLGEGFERIGDSLPFIGAQAVKNAGNGPSPVPLNSVNEGLPVFGECQRDISTIARKVTSIKKPGLQ